MKVLFDHQIYNDKNYGGISRYFFELTRGLPELGIDVENTIRFSENEFMTDRKHFHSSPFISFNFKGKGWLKRYINRTISESAIKKGKFDILHPTYYNTYFIDKRLNKKPLVVTFHDLIHEKFGARFPNELKDLDHVISERRKLLDAAARIISVSESTKRDIIEYYGVDERKIEVIHLSNSLEVENISREDSAEPYLLFVGNRAAYKNFALFLRAVSPLLQAEKDLKIICAGGGYLTDEERTLIQSLGIGEQVSQVSINDTRLISLYQNALLFVFPSLYEGFGIPVLEAFACGCPTALSNVGSLPEVGGNAAAYFDPENQKDMYEKIRELVFNSHLRESFRQRGLERAKAFSWKETCSKTKAVYESA